MLLKRARDTGRNGPYCYRAGWRGDASELWEVTHLDLCTGSTVCGGESEDEYGRAAAVPIRPEGGLKKCAAAVGGLAATQDCTPPGRTRRWFDIWGRQNRL